MTKEKNDEGFANLAQEVMRRFYVPVQMEKHPPLGWTLYWAKETGRRKIGT